MGESTAIEWTDATWTPIRARNRSISKAGWHCEHVSEGCRNCYAEAMNRRLGTGFDFKPGHRADIEVFLDEAMLVAPLRWRRPRRIFVCSMTDLFADFVPDAMLDRIFAIMALCPQHTFQVLTKRPARMRAYMNEERRDAWVAASDGFVGAGMLSAQQYADRGQRREERDGVRHWSSRFADWPLPNVWLGTSCEDQATADARIPDLLATPAAIRFASAEPLLGPIDFRWIAEPDDDADGVIDALLGCNWIDGFGCGVTFKPVRPGHEDRTMTREVVGIRPTKLDWVIVGGEKGPRPMHPDWARAIRDQCVDAAVAFLFKQWGSWTAEIDRDRDDPDWRLNYSRKFADLDPFKWLNLAGGRGFHGERFHVMRRVDKRAAGRLLDGVTHDGMPVRKGSAA